MEYKETVVATSSSHNDNNRIVDSDDDGTNWESLAVESSQTGSGAKRKRNWASKGRYGGSAKRKKANSPKKRKAARKPAGTKKTPAKRALGKITGLFSIVFIRSVTLLIFTGFLQPKF